jgi:hypothetical protein
LIRMCLARSAVTHKPWRRYVPKVRPMKIGQVR